MIEVKEKYKTLRLALILSFIMQILVIISFYIRNSSESAEIILGQILIQFTIIFLMSTLVLYIIISLVKKRKITK